ncbi:MAG: hypothetical protein ACE5WD_11930 [Candidatus Aminicenantia bacterium]
MQKSPRAEPQCEARIKMTGQKYKNSAAVERCCSAAHNSPQHCRTAAQQHLKKLFFIFNLSFCHSGIPHVVYQFLIFDFLFLCGGETEK